MRTRPEFARSMHEIFLANVTAPKVLNKAVRNISVLLTLSNYSRTQCTCNTTTQKSITTSQMKQGKRVYNRVQRNNVHVV